jgi:hypothetical protein
LRARVSNKFRSTFTKLGNLVTHPSISLRYAGKCVTKLGNIAVTAVTCLRHAIVLQRTIDGGAADHPDALGV